MEVINVKVGDSKFPTNCYIVHNNIQGIIIDPGYDFEKIKEKTKDIDIQYIVITHAHGDHIGALEEAIKYTKAKVIIHEDDKDGLLDSKKPCYDATKTKKQNINEEDILTVTDNDNINIAGQDMKFIHTPGHTNGSMCLLLDDKLFTGDTIFSNCYGRTDLFSGSFEDMKKSLDKLFNMFNDIIIYPGHGKEANIDDVKRVIKLLFAIRRG